MYFKVISRVYSSELLEVLARRACALSIPRPISCAPPRIGPAVLRGEVLTRQRVWNRVGSRV